MWSIYGGGIPESPLQLLTQFMTGVAGNRGFVLFMAVNTRFHPQRLHDRGGLLESLAVTRVAFELHGCVPGMAEVHEVGQLGEYRARRALRHRYVARTTLGAGGQTGALLLVCPRMTARAFQL